MLATRSSNIGAAFLKAGLASLQSVVLTILKFQKKKRKCCIVAGPCSLYLSVYFSLTELCSY
jgi:hypothetical protein